MRRVPWLMALAATSVAAPALAVGFDDLDRGARVRLRTGASDSVWVTGTVVRLVTASGERLSQGVLYVNVEGSERAFRLGALGALVGSQTRTWMSLPLERTTGWRPDLAAGPVVRLTVRW
jgi:hypothetical protein